MKMLQLESLGHSVVVAEPLKGAAWAQPPLQTQVPPRGCLAPAAWKVV